MPDIFALRIPHILAGSADAIRIINTDPKEPFTFSEKTEQYIEQGWGLVNERRPIGYNSRLLRVVGTDINDGSVVVRTTSDIFYKDVVGLRAHSDFERSIPTSEHIKALSCMIIPTTKDGSVFFIERDSGDWEHSLEFPGGFVRTSEPKDGYDMARLKLAGDLGIDINMAEQFLFKGLLDYADICEAMMVFEARIMLSFDSLQGGVKRKLFSTPRNYEVETHSAFFDMPLHLPSAAVTKLFVRHTNLSEFKKSERREAPCSQ